MYRRARTEDSRDVRRHPGDAYGVDAQTGESSGRLKVDDACAARAHRRPVIDGDGRLYARCRDSKKSGARPNHRCGTFRDIVVALDAATGKQMGKTYMIPDEPKITARLQMHAALEAGWC